MSSTKTRKLAWHNYAMCFLFADFFTASIFAMLDGMPLGLPFFLIFVVWWMIYESSVRYWRNK